MRRRGRDLTPDDRAIWETVEATVTPLQPRTRPAAGRPVAPAAPLVPPPAGQPVVPAPRPAPVAQRPPSIAAPAGDGLRMDRGRFEKLRRGRLKPEARLDLHGMTAERAHAALTGFIRMQHEAGCRLVLVITGKGRVEAEATAARRHGILRHSVPHWLAAPPLVNLVLEVVPAHPTHGGAGALYVYLRRRR